MQIQKILNNYSKPRSFTQTCILGGEEEKTNAKDGKISVNSFPEFGNEKDFEIKLSLSLTSFALLQFASF